MLLDTDAQAGSFTTRTKRGLDHEGPVPFDDVRSRRNKQKTSIGRFQASLSLIVNKQVHNVAISRTL